MTVSSFIDSKTEINSLLCERLQIDRQPVFRANRRWRLPFRYNGSRQESAVALLSMPRCMTRHEKWSHHFYRVGCRLTSLHTFRGSVCFAPTDLLQSLFVAASIAAFAVESASTSSAFWKFFLKYFLHCPKG